MTTLARIDVVPEPVDAKVTNDALTVKLSDGRIISAPVVWFPRLLHGTPVERAKFELGRSGIHWPDLNEDIPVEGLLRGEKSGESMKSIQRWLEYRARGEKEPVVRLPVPADLAKYLAREKAGNKSQRRTQRRRKAIAHR